MMSTKIVLVFVNKNDKHSLTPIQNATINKKKDMATVGDCCPLVQDIQTALTVSPMGPLQTCLEIYGGDDDFHCFLLQRVLQVLRENGALFESRQQEPVEFNILELTPAIWLHSAWVLFFMGVQARAKLRTVYTHHLTCFHWWSDGVFPYAGFQQLAAATTLVLHHHNFCNEMGSVELPDHYWLITDDPIKIPAWQPMLTYKGWSESRHRTYYYISPLFLGLSVVDWQAIVPRFNDTAQVRQFRHMLTHYKPKMGAFAAQSQDLKKRSGLPVDKDTCSHPTRVCMTHTVLPNVFAASARADKVTWAQGRTMVSMVYNLTAPSAQFCLQLLGLEQLPRDCQLYRDTIIALLNNPADRQQLRFRAVDSINAIWDATLRGEGSYATFLRYIKGKA